MATAGRGRGRGRGRSPAGKPNPIDIHVGSRIRLRRTLLGMSQQRLGEAIGLTFQQVQKYERGANRVGSSRMFELARVLEVPISYFFEEMGADTAQRGRQHAMGHAIEVFETAEPDPMTKRETLELVRAYYKITDARVRRRLFEMTKALASAAASATAAAGERRAK
jgi:transcriptional regulator with XRE-family HTH domain